MLALPTNGLFALRCVDALAPLLILLFNFFDLLTIGTLISQPAALPRAARCSPPSPACCSTCTPPCCCSTFSCSSCSPSESDASYYTEDLPIAAYQPVVTNVLQPLEHAGEDGDTEAAGGGARMQRGRRPNQRARQQAKKKAAQEAAPQPAAGDGDSGVGQ